MKFMHYVLFFAAVAVYQQNHFAGAAVPWKHHFEMKVEDNSSAAPDVEEESDDDDNYALDEDGNKMISKPKDKSVWSTSYTFSILFLLVVGIPAAYCYGYRSLDEADNHDEAYVPEPAPAPMPMPAVPEAEVNTDGTVTQTLETASHSEMIKNPVVLAMFRFWMTRPKTTTFLFVLWICFTMFVGSWYDDLKYAPISKSMFDDKLTRAHQKTAMRFRSEFSNSSQSLAVLWSEHGGDMRRNNAINETRHDIDMRFEDLKNGTKECATLNWIHHDDSRIDQAQLSQAQIDHLHQCFDRPFQSPNNDAGVILLKLEGQNTKAFGQSHPCFESARKILRKVSGAHGDIKVAMYSGEAVSQAAMSNSVPEMKHHLWHSTFWMLILLMCGVGTLPRAITPFLCMGCAVLGMRASMVCIKWCYPDLNFSMPDTGSCFLLFAFACDYGLFHWARFAVERRKFPQAHMIHRAGMTALVSSGYVIILSMSVLVLTFSLGSFYSNMNMLGSLGHQLQVITGMLFLAYYSLLIPTIAIALFPYHFDEPRRDGVAKALATYVRDSLTVRPIWIRWLAAFITKPPFVCLVPMAIFVLFTPLIYTFTTLIPSYNLITMIGDQSLPEYQGHLAFQQRFVRDQFHPMMILMEAIPVDSTSEKTEVAFSPEFGAAACSFVDNIFKETKGTKYQVEPADIDGIWYNAGQCKTLPSAHSLVNWVNPYKESRREYSEMASEKLMHSTGLRDFNSMQQWMFDGSIRKNMTSIDGMMNIFMLTPKTAAFGNTEKEMTQTFWDKIQPMSEVLFTHKGEEFVFKPSIVTEMAEQMMLQQQQTSQLPWILATTFLSINVLLGYAFRSVFVSIKLVFTVVIPCLAVWGTIVGIYQHGWFERFGVHVHDLPWSIFFETPTMLFALALDYDMFLFARVYERRLEGYDNVSAVRIGVEETQPTIQMAGCMMVVCFAFLASSAIPILKIMGFIYCVGVIMDVYIVRMLLDPAALSVFENLNYWPTKMPKCTMNYDHYNRLITESLLEQHGAGCNTLAMKDPKMNESLLAQV